MNAIEFGSGRSTKWFARKVAHLTSVEDNASWHAIVSKELRELNLTNVDYRLIPLDHPAADPEQEEYSPVPKYVAAADSFPDRSFDLAIVDGHYRTHCIRHVVSKLKPGGLLLVDDINLWPAVSALPIPADWPIADDSSNGVKRCIIWRAL